MRVHLATATAIGALLLAGAATGQVTGFTGGGQPINNYQPSLVLTQTVQTAGIYPSRQAEFSGAENVLSMVHTYAGNFGPFGQPQAQGQILSIQQNTALFSLLGTNYGGNGTTNFGLPNLAGKVAIGAGNGPGLSGYVVGQQAGSATDIMTLSQLPAHNHGLPGGGVTGVTGAPSPAPLNNIQPSLALNYEIAVSGIYPSQGGGGAVDGFLGQVSLVPTTFATNGYMLANGQLLSIAQNSALFSVIGTTYGGDGQTTFALPDLMGRTPVGVGAGISLGQAFGTEGTILGNANLPSHDHTLPGGGVTGSDGFNVPFSNYQPSLGLNYLIALQGLFPSRDGDGDDPGANIPTLGEIIAFAGTFAPSGYAFAQGQILSIAQNAALFSLLGTNYGGNGTTTFALPDLRGRSIVGAGGQFIVGERFGTASETLNVNELVAHDHTLPDPGPGGVPEPATWAMMVLGFGVLGGALRTRRHGGARVSA